MLKDFKQFILRGNVVDLAVAVVVGAAFGAIVTALVADFITPLIAAITNSTGGKTDFSKLYFTINGSQFLYGHFLNAIISFLLIAAVVFFLIVQPVNHLANRAKRKDEPSPDPTTKKCPECISEIPIAATRCAFCTSKLPAKSKS